MKECIDNVRYLCSDAIWYGEKYIWLSAMEFNGLYQYDIENKKTIFIGSFPNEANDEWRLHGKAVKAGHEIYFLPDRSRYIHIYNIEKNVLSALDMEIDVRMSCQNGFYNEGKIYFICSRPDIMICSIDVVTKEIKKEKIEIENYRNRISSDIVVLKDKLYFTFPDSDIVIEYLYKSNKYELYHLGEDLGGFGTICHDGKVFWLSGKNKVVRWDKENSQMKSFCDFPEGFGMCIRLDMKSDEIVSVRGFTDEFLENEQPFVFSAFFCGKVWLFPNRVNMIICMDVRTGYIEEFYIQDEQEDKESLLFKHRNTHCHYRGGMQDNMLVFISTKSKKLRMIQQDGKIHKELYLKCKEPNDIFSYLIGSKINHRCEDENLNSLREFLLIKFREDITNITDKKDVGTLIYKKMRE